MHKNKNIRLPFVRHLLYYPFFCTHCLLKVIYGWSHGYRCVNRSKLLLSTTGLQRWDVWGGCPVQNMTMWNVVKLPLPPTMQLESRWIEAAFRIIND